MVMPDPQVDGNDAMAISRIIMQARNDCPDDTLTLLVNAALCMACFCGATQEQVMAKIEETYATIRRGMN